MTRRSGLGRGLSSLIPPSAGADQPNATGSPVLVEVPVAQIRPNPHQPRLHFDEDSLAELAASIAQIGVLQPVLVRPLGGTDDPDDPDGAADGILYELIAGERRWRAAGRVGLTTIPAVVRATDDLASVEQALVENLHRQDLTPLEEAAAYQQLIEDFGLTHEQLAERVGKKRSSITNTLRLLGLPPTVQHLLVDGRLTAGHARALLGTPDRTLQDELARAVADEGWSVRAVEEAVRRGSLLAPDVEESTGPSGESGIADVAEVASGDVTGGTGDSGTGGGGLDGAGLTGATRLRPPGLLELEELLAAHFDTRVSVQMSARRGRVVIEFADLEDLERLYGLMVPVPGQAHDIGE